MNMNQYAEAELDLINEDKETKKIYLELIDVKGKFGDSGGSHPFRMAVIERLMNYKPLSPITEANVGWNKCTRGKGHPDVFQSSRLSSMFLEEGLVHDLNLRRGRVFKFITAPLRFYAKKFKKEKLFRRLIFKPINFPYNPK